MNRLIALPAKVRRQGCRWATRRLLQKILSPYTIVGRWLRILLFRVVLRSDSKRDDSELFFACYDLDTSAVTFDFAWFLIGAEMATRRANKQGFHLVIIPGRKEGFRDEDEEYEKIIDKKERRRRIHSIIQPLAKMHPFCQRISICSTREEAQKLLDGYGGGPIVYPDLYHTSIAVEFSYRQIMTDGTVPGAFEGFRANSDARLFVENWMKTNVPEGCLPVVITLRHYSFMPSRNSDLAAWSAFSRGLDRKKYWPIFIHDAEAKLEDFSNDFEGECFFPEAAHDVALRMAVYELAYLNMFVNNGPAALAQLNPNCRYLYFKIMVPDCPQTTEKFLRRRNWIPGETPRFAKPWQKWVWKDDRTEVIVQEFESMCSLIEQSSTPRTY